MSDSLPDSKSPKPEGRILIVDDDADLCVVSKQMLEFLGYQADTAMDGHEAIGKFRSQLESGDPYFAVILDLTMPGGVGGVDVLVALKEMQPTVKAIVSSGYASAERADTYREMGFTAILAKPYRSSDICRALREVIADPR